MKEKCCWFIIIYSYKLIKIYSYKLIKSLMQNENASIFFFFLSLQLRVQSQTGSDEEGRHAPVIYFRKEITYTPWRHGIDQIEW